jgi:hypothetical protein
MKRISQGVEYPKWWVDVFTGKTTSIFGEITCVLSHTPKPNGIFVQVDEDVGGNSNFNYWFQQVTGRSVIVAFYKMRSKEPDPLTGTTDAAGGGAVGEPHTHAVTKSWADMSVRPHGVFSPPPVRIRYELA